MTAAFYNTVRHPDYGAAELKRLAGKHAMYGLFFSVGVVGAVFLVVFTLVSLTDSRVLPRLPSTTIPLGPHPFPDSKPAETETGKSNAGMKSEGALATPVAPVIGTVPVDVMELPVDNGLIDTPFDNGNGDHNTNPLGNGNGNDLIPSGNGGGNNSVIGQGNEEEEPAFEEIPAVLPSVDEADLHSKVVYPPMAKRIGLEGKVMVEVLIDARGRAVAVNIVSSTDELFNKAALDAVAGAKFKPAYSNGRPVQFRLYVPIEFKMK